MHGMQHIGEATQVASLWIDWPTYNYAKPTLQFDLTSNRWLEIYGPK